MKKNKVILYVEDDNNIASVYTDFLKRRVETVIIAIDGIDGLHKFSIHKPDLVITDIQMPKANGIELINAIRKLNTTVPIIVLSAYANEDFIINSIRDKISAHLKKPVDNKELSVLIEQVFTVKKIAKPQTNINQNDFTNKKSLKIKATSSELLIVGVGSSAGGLEALSAMVANLPILNNTAYIVAQHLSPTHKTMLVELLSRETNLKVKDAEDGEEIQADVIYITPPNRNIELNKKNQILLLPTEKHSFLPKPSVNQLLISLAQTKKDQSVGIILSGTGSDGAQGMRAINAEGGITIVQDPKSAKYDGMPVASINGASVDMIVEASQIGGELVALSNFPRHKVLEKYQVAQASDEMGIIFSMLYKYKKVDFSLYKKSTIVRRIERRMVSRKVTNLLDYVEILLHDDNEVGYLYNDLLIGVTTFFRDKEAFAAIHISIENYIENNPDLEELRIWLPGASTGEEAYSVVMMLKEILQERFYEIKIQLFATDIDENSLKDARRGRYSATSMPKMDEEKIKEYFYIKDNEFEIKKELREKIVFSVHNILTDPPFKNLDLIVCRNLLIYFTLEAQKYIMPMFHYALRKDGLLFLGKSENVTKYEHLFATVNKENKIFKYIESSRIDYNVSNVKLPVYSAQETNKTDMVVPETKLPLHELIKEEAVKILLPNLVVTNEQMEVIYKKGSMDYIEVPEGYVSYNLYKMLNSHLSIELRSAVNNATKSNGVVSTPYFPIKDKNNNARFLKVYVIPVKDGRSIIYLIYFNEICTMNFAQLNLGNTDNLSVTATATDSLLELELSRTKEHMQTLVEELETSNEELQSTNEELQSSNEELQSTNEELETTNEELQSTNEELQTAYSELKELYNINNEHKNELVNLTNRYESLFDNMNDALIVSRMDGVIVRTNSAMQRIMNSPKDGLITQRWQDFIKGYDHKIEHEKADVLLKNGKTDSYLRTIILKDKSEKILKIQDYLIKDENEAFQVWSFASDFTREKKIKSELTNSEEKYKSTFNQAVIGIAHINLKGKVIDVNSTFYQTLSYSKDEFLGLDLINITDEKYREEEILLQEKLINNELKNYKIEKQFITKTKQKLWVSASVSLIQNSKNTPPYFVYIVEDINNNKKAHEKLQQAEVVFNSTQESIVVVNHLGKIVRVNKACEEMSGYCADEIIDKDMNIFKSEEQVEQFYQNMWNDLDKSGAWSGEVVNNHKDGSKYPVFLTINVVRDANNKVIQYIGVATDISTVKNSQRKITYLANHDVLTGLANRTLLLDRLRQAIENSKRRKTSLAVMFLDLDRFKIVNDALGHDAGDQVLKEVSKRFNNIIRAEDTLARVGGDEFVIVLENLKSPIYASNVATKIIEAVGEPITIGKDNISVGASIGVSVFPNDASSPEELLRQADFAMYEAKKSGRNDFRFTSEELSSNALERATLEHALKEGLNKNQFRLVYQPIVDIKTNTIKHFEALIRWEHDILGTVTPGKFIPIAEETDLIVAITDFVIYETIQSLKVIKHKPEIKISINYSYRDLQSDSLFKKFMTYTAQAKVNPASIIIELTERKLMLNQGGEHIAWMQRYRDIGVRFALDDFGTGYSNLSYLNELPMYYLKIDRSFIINIGRNEKSNELIKATIAMSKALGFKVIAEGVETKEQCRFLQDNGCELIQGFYFFTPKKFKLFDSYLSGKKVVCNSGL